MHPAPSLILFTTLSGAGFGLLVFLGLGLPPVTGLTAFAFFALAYLLAVGGLVASVFHLGHPERALKAFREWRSSWLSREAWAAVATLVTMALYGAALVFFDTRIVPLGWIGAALSTGTVFATSMIYTSIRAIPRWHHWSTPALFLAYAIASGALLSGQVGAALVLFLVLGLLQLWAWRDGDRRLARSGTTLGTATGLDGRGTVRAFEPPHTGENYLTREMAFVVARKHAERLRAIALLFVAILPAMLLLLPFSHLNAGLAVLSFLAGTAVARWLFYAEAEHVVRLYYGR